jgi:hypothetical protein
MSVPVPEKALVLLDFFGATRRIRTDDVLITTKTGAFVCEKEADKAGDRATQNGQ